MSIYCLSPDVDNVMFFTIDDNDVYKKMENFDIEGFGAPLKFSWVAPNAKFIASDSGSKVLPDISQWNGVDLILSDKAKRVLDDVLKDNGEYYPLAGGCKGYWFYNPTQKLGNSVINLEKTTSHYFDDGSWERIASLVFNALDETSLSAVFSLEIDRGVNLYCSDLFKDIIEKNGLVGINFSIVSK